jgi:hypothetical protein
MIRVTALAFTGYSSSKGYWIVIVFRWIQDSKTKQKKEVD